MVKLDEISRAIAKYQVHAYLNTPKRQEKLEEIYTLIREERRRIREEEIVLCRFVEDILRLNKESLKRRHKA